MTSVALFTNWREPFESLIERLEGQTLRLGDRFYKDLYFVDPDVIPTYDYALVLNMTTKPIGCSPDRVFVLVLEPPELMDGHWGFVADDGLNVWHMYHERTGGVLAHPQQLGHIYYFTSGTDYPTALGIGLTQTKTTDLLPGDKPRRCSMICSSKMMTPWQVRRREILGALLDSDLDIDFYGRGLSGDDPRIKGELPIGAKHEALYDYRFVIDFENSEHDAITDKMFDPLLCGCIPVTNSTGAHKVFPDGSYRFVDFALSTDEIVERIRGIIAEDDIDRYNDSVIKARRRLVDGTLNICEWLRQRIQEHARPI